MQLLNLRKDIQEKIILLGENITTEYNIQFAKTTPAIGKMEILREKMPIGLLGRGRRGGWGEKKERI